MMLNGNAILKCSPRLAAGSAALRWLGPRNQLLATGGVISVTSNSSKYDIVDRSSGSSEPALIINDVGLEDDGVYRCLEANSLTELSSFNVTVLGELR